MPTFDTQNIRFGVQGLDIASASDTLPSDAFTLLKNVVQDVIGGWTTRKGIEELATSGVATDAHSISRLNDPQAGTFTRVFGIGGSLYYGQSGALTVADTGYASTPFSLVPYRSPFSGQTWMYVANQARMRKVRVDGLDLPIGLPAPATPTTALATELTVDIENFESAASFNPEAGSGGAPVLSNVTGKVGDALNILTDPGAATSAYYNMATKAKAIDLSTFGSGVDSTDEDFIHLWLRVDQPQYLQEVVVYFVTSAFTLASNTPPGTNTAENTTAFMKAFAPSDFTSVIEQITTTQEIITDLSSNYTLDTGLQETPAPTSQFVTQTISVGRGAWTEYSKVDVPLRKGDFVEIGESPDWSTITGLVILVRVSTPAQVVNVAIDNMYLTGGRGLDSANLGTEPYDYRVTNYDTRTGDEGNPSTTQASDLFLESLRRGITIDPAAYGDTAVRQRIYRRGGTLNDNWYFVGTNASDGAAFTDTLSDAEIEAAGSLETDNDQPVTTVNGSGVTVLAQPVQALWGPAYDMLFACGDPYRPGYVYWSKPGHPDNWPAENSAEVCSTSEQLMHGCVYGGQAYVFSRERMYVLISNIQSDGSITPQPTDCNEGLISPWTLCVGGGAMWFVSATGVYMTAGGAQTNITDAYLKPLFGGSGTAELPPINFALPNSMRLVFLNNELFFIYEDTSGNTQMLVYGMLPGRNFWRQYDFEIDIAGAYAEISGQDNPSLLIGGGNTGSVYIHTGTEDDSVPITARIMTGYNDQGMSRRDKAYAGDVAVNAGGTGSLNVRMFFDVGQTVSPTATINLGGRETYLCDILSDLPRAKNAALDISWTGTGPSIYWAGYPYAPDPIEHIRWDTDWIDHGLPGWQVPIYGELTLIAENAVALSVYAKNFSSTISTKTYHLGHPSGKQKIRLDFEAQRGVEFRYVFTSTSPFKLFWEESVVFVQQWGSIGALTKYVFGAELGGPTTSNISPAQRASKAGGG